MAYKIKKLDKKIELIKALHKPINKIDLLDLIDSVNDDPESKERTLRNYKEEGDIEIGKAIIPFKVHKTRDGRTLSNSEKKKPKEVKTYDLLERSSVHPVILPLNLVEVHYLTSGILNKLGANHPDYEIYKGIANKIYSQLSDYGKEIISRSGHDFEDLNKVMYTRECDMVNGNSRVALAMAEKSETRAKIILLDGQCLYGKVKYKNTDFYLITDDGEELLLDNLGIKDVEN